MSGRMEFEFGLRDPRRAAAAERDEETPLRILLLGDFSGRGAHGGQASGARLAERRPVAVDVDNFDDVLFRFAPQVQIPAAEAAGGALTLTVTNLDQFHPDHLFGTLAVFQALRGLRERLRQPATFAEAAAELRRAALVAPPAPPDTPAPPPAATGTDETDATTLERILGATPVATAPRAAAPDAIARLIQEVVAPHLSPKADPLQPVYVAAVDAAIAAQMRRILHAPAFQAVESAWRGVAWLLAQLSTGEELKLYLLDVSQAELGADLTAAGNQLPDWGLYKLLVEHGVRMVGGEPWSLLAGLYTFGTSAGDLQLLAALGALAAQAGGPFVAAAAPALLGCRSLAETPDPATWQPLDADAARRWQTLRTSPAAAWLGLVLPRLLLRLPYGKRHGEVEQFAFEEVLDPQEHAAFLWGPPALACAYLIGAAFNERSWSMQPGDVLEVEDLPAYTYQQDGEPRLLPGSEVCLTERAMDAILGRGIMPLLSYKNRNAVRLARFQSLADPPAGLAGPWR